MWSKYVKIKELPEVQYLCMNNRFGGLISTVTKQNRCREQELGVVYGDGEYCQGTNGRCFASIPKPESQGSHLCAVQKRLGRTLSSEEYTDLYVARNRQGRGLPLECGVICPGQFDEKNLDLYTKDLS